MYLSNHSEVKLVWIPNFPSRVSNNDCPTIHPWLEEEEIDSFLFQENWYEVKYKQTCLEFVLWSSIPLF